MTRGDSLSKSIFLVFIFISTVSSHLFSQNNYERKITISEWVSEMENHKGPQFILENTEIYYDAKKDTLFSWAIPRPKPNTDDTIKRNITSNIVIYNCKLPTKSTVQIRNVNFKNNITFALCEGASQLIFYNSTFNQGVDFQHSDLGIVQFEYCTIKQRTVVNECQISMLVYRECTLYTDHKVVKSLYKFGTEQEDQSYQYLFNIRQNDKMINSFLLNNCVVLKGNVTPVISFFGGKYDIISFENNDFSNSILDFSYCSVKENFKLRNCKINVPFGMHNFNFPNDNTSFYWKQVDSIGLGVYTDYNLPPFSHKSDSLISDIYIFNELTSSYRKFYSMYRTQGDIESANACFMQLKDMETMKYSHLFEQEPNTNRWFNWRFNQFLKYFSDYGTNPVKSLIISMWTILMFAAIYFFFYSYWDGINRSFLIKQHRKVMLYFRSEQRLEDFYTESHKEDFKTFADYKNEMNEGKGGLPIFIILLGKPLYVLSVIRHKILTFIYRRTEILQGKWVDLKPARKVLAGTSISITILIYAFYLITIRAINSTTLSINAFSTLGFGAIPVKGISRYITIIEGFLGWFLLSIFSVSLISQMLQN